MAPPQGMIECDDGIDNHSDGKIDFPLAGTGDVDCIGLQDGHELSG